MPEDSQLLPQTPLPEPPPVIVPEPQPEWRPGQEHPSWTVWDAVAIFLVFVVSVAIVGAITLVIAAHIGVDRGAPITELARDPKVVVTAQSLAYLMTIFVIYVIVRTRDTTFLRAIRWNFPWRRLVVFFIGGIGLSVVVQIASSRLPIPKSLPIEHMFRNADDAWIMTAFGCTVAPFVEELLFRGVLYPALARPLRMAGAVAVTALGFALLHGSQLAFAWAPLLMLLIVGTVLTVVRARTGSVGASFLVHAGYNLSLFFVLWLHTDHFQHMQKMAS